MRALAGPKLAWSWLITVHIDYEWIDGGDFDGATVFEHAQSLGLEGIVSKHKNSRYVSGRSPYWLKMKNPESVAARREAEEEWGR